MSEAESLFKQSLAFGSALNKIQKKPSYGQKIFRKLISKNSQKKPQPTITAPNTPSINSKVESLPSHPSLERRRSSISSSQPELNRSSTIEVNLQASRGVHNSAHEDECEGTEAHLTSSGSEGGENTSLTESKSQKSTVVRSNSEKRLSGTIQKRGFLMRKNGAMGAWSDLYFVLDTGFLMEYKASANESDKPRKVFNLARCSLKYNAEVTGYPFVFSLTVSDQYSIFLQPPDEPQLVEWILLLRNVCSDYDVVWRAEKLLDAFHDGIFVVSSNGIILQANEKIISTLEATRENIVGSHVEIYLPMIQKEESASSETDLGGKILRDFLNVTRRMYLVKLDGSQVNVYVNIGEFTVDTETKMAVTIKLEDDALTSRYLNDRIDRIIESTVNELQIEFKNKLRTRVKTFLIQHTSPDMVGSPSNSVPASPSIRSPARTQSLFSPSAPAKFTSSGLYQVLSNWRDYTGYLRFLVFLALLTLSLVMVMQLLMVQKTKSIYNINFIAVAFGFLLISVIIVYFLREEGRSTFIDGFRSPLINRPTR